MKGKRPGRMLVFIVLMALGLLSVLSFLAILPAEGEFVLRALSIVFMVVVMYHAGLSKTMFGIQDKLADWCILSVSLVLSLRPILRSLLGPLQGGFIEAFLIAADRSIDDTTIYAFVIVLLFVFAIVMAKKVRLKSPSIMNMIGENGPIKHLDGFTIRAILMFFLLVAFYIVVFDIALQWWNVITGTAAIVMLLTILLVIILKKGKGMSMDSILRYIENLDNKYFDRIVDLFHERHTVLFGVAALLVFYPLSDLGTFLIPYLTNIPNDVILALGPNHLPLPVLGYETITQSDLMTGIFAAIAYALNGLFAVLALFSTAWFWHRAFKKQSLVLPPLPTSIIVAATTCAIITPAFSLSRMSSSNAAFVGVDIMTHSLTGAPVMLSVLSAILLGIVAYKLSRKHPVFFSVLIMVVTLGFLGQYLITYFSDVWSELLAAALLFLKEATVRGFLAGFLFLAFLSMSLIFYVGAIAAYFYEIWVSLWHEHSKR